MLRLFRAVAVALAVFVPVSAFALWGLFDRYTNVALEGDVLSLPADLKAGDAKFYRTKKDGQVIRFFVAKDARDVLHVALDACDVCWKEGKGYELEGDAVVCTFCGLKFPLERIGLKAGGCNPHALPFKQEGASVLIDTADLLAGTGYFPENKK